MATEESYIYAALARSLNTTLLTFTEEIMETFQAVGALKGSLCLPVASLPGLCMQ